jgi:hypothetical protein
MYMEEKGWEGQLATLNERVRARDDAYMQLLLLSSEPLIEWLRHTYNPLEYELKRTYVRQVRYGGTPSEERHTTSTR